MATSPARAGVIRPIPYNWIAKRIEDERDQKCCPYERWLQTHHSSVKEQQEIGEAIVLDAVRNAAKAVAKADAQADRFAIRVLAVCCVRDLDNLMRCLRDARTMQQFAAHWRISQWQLPNACKGNYFYVPTGYALPEISSDQGCLVLYICNTGEPSHEEATELHPSAQPQLYHDAESYIDIR